MTPRATSKRHIRTSGEHNQSTNCHTLNTTLPLGLLDDDDEDDVESSFDVDGDGSSDEGVDATACRPNIFLFNTSS